MAKPEKLDEGQIQNIVSNAVGDAIDFVESEIVSNRLKSQRYFDGQVDIGEEEGRSKIVSTKVRDTVRQIKPSLMRVFLSSENPVEYVPSGAEDVQMAEQATRYAGYVFQKADGYRRLNDAIHDALVKKTGILKIYWEDYEDAKIYDFTNLTEEEMTVLVNEKGVDVLEQSMETSVEIDEFGMQVEMPRYTLKVSRRDEKGKLCVDSVPPEEFYVDRNATCLEDAYVVAHKREMTVSELVSMGYDFDKVSELTGSSVDDTFSEAEKFERTGYADFDEEERQDPSMKLIEVTEAYMKMDVYGTGIPIMHRVLMGGGRDEIIDYEPWGTLPFAIYEVDPEPHSFFGRSVSDLIMNDQDSSTAMIRGILDNVALTNNPSIDVVEGQVNIDDVLNNEIGSIRRVKTQGAIQTNAVPFVAGQTLSAVQYMDLQTESKTGVSKASMGLDPEALSNQTATGAQLTAQAGAGQIEVMARNLAEGGMKQTFRLLLELLIENSCEETMMRLNGQYTPIDPRSWNAEMDISVNVGIGMGREEQKAVALNQALQTQMTIYGQYGSQNGLVTLTQIRNTLGDILALNGVRNSDRYFNPLTPEIEQQLIMQQQQQMAQQGQQPTPEQTIAQAQVQAEQIKAESKAQTDMLKAQIDAQKAIAQDDRERDKLDQDLLIKTAEIMGKHGTAVDVERIKQMQNAPRYPNATPTQAVQQGGF